METVQRDFGVAYIEFLAKAQETVDRDYAAFNPNGKGNLTAPKLTGEGGPRYIRIVSSDCLGSSRSAFGFIDKTNGNVLKAAGWKAPAKNFARGNIFDEKHGCGRIRWTGVQ